MANTFDAALIMDTLSNQVITFLPDRLAPLRAFSRDFTTDELVQQEQVQVPLVTAGSTTLTNPTNFESGDTTVSKVSVTVNHLSQPFHITSKEYNQRLRIERLAKGNLQAFAHAISDVNTALMTVANFSAATVAATFTTATAQTLWAAIELAGPKYLILDSVAYASLAPSDRNSFKLGEEGAYGFDGIFHQTRWTGATANTYGFACSPDAIATAAGIPLQVPGLAADMVDQRIVSVDQLGLSVQLNLWVSRATRNLWASYDIMYGAAAGGLPAAGELVVTV